MAQRTPGRIALPYLTAWREHRLKTLRALSEESVVSANTISRIENGRRLANYATVGKLARALKISPGELVRVNPEQEKAKGEA